MGSQAASTTESSLRIFWQARPVKYKLNTGEKIFNVEEVKSPWDLYIEGMIFDSEVGDTLHQVMVGEGMERVFSIRNEEGNPLCDILTKPEKAPALDFSYGARRVFRTSAPMTVDGEKLIVLDVIAKRGNRASEPCLKLARDFYLAMGGRLTEEHPNGLIYKDKKDIRRWRKVIDADLLVDLVVSDKVLKGSQPIRSDAFRAITPNMAKTLLDTRYWDTLHLNGEMDWSEEIVAYIEADEDAIPHKVIVYGSGDQVNALFARVQKFYEEKPK